MSNPAPRPIKKKLNKPKTHREKVIDETIVTNNKVKRKYKHLQCQRCSLLGCNQGSCKKMTVLRPKESNPYVSPLKQVLMK